MFPSRSSWAVFGIYGSLLSLSAFGGAQSQIPIPPLQQPPKHASDPFIPELDRFVQEALEGWHVPSVSFAVIDKGEIYSKGYGLSNLPDTHATGDTLYHIGSLTKAFTAAAAALVEQDASYNLTWTSRIRDHLPHDFIIKDDEYATRYTTLEDALSHRTGFPRHDLSYGWDGDKDARSTVRSMRHLPMADLPRTRFMYCNMMYAAVQHLIETITDIPLGNFFTKYLYKPLGMQSTFLHLRDAKIFIHENPERSIARGYHYVLKTGGDAYYIPEPYIDLDSIAGAGAAVSSANDLALWTKAWLELSDWTGTNYSSPMNTQVYHNTLTPRSIIPATLAGLVGGAAEPNDFITPPDYGLGWFTATLEGVRVVFHGGDLTGFGADIFMLPDHQYGVVALGNGGLYSHGVNAAAISYLLRSKLPSNGAEHAGESRMSLEDLTSQVHKLIFPPRPSDSHTWSEEDLRPASTEYKDEPADLTGDYFHPGYGPCSITHYDSSGTLLMTLSNRTWMVDGLIYPKSGEFFETLVRRPHGNFADDSISGLENICKPPQCRREVAYDYDGLIRVRFTTDNEGRTMFGVELERELFDPSSPGYKRPWNESMIWFTKR